MAAAFTLLLLVKLLIALSVAFWPLWLMKLAVAFMFCTFALLTLAGFTALAQALTRNINRYFSAPQRRQRQLWQVQALKQQTLDLQPQKMAQLRYFHELERKKLLRKDDNKHIADLSAAIKKDLLSARSLITKQLAKELRQQHRVARKRRDGEALVSLQEKIALLTKTTCRE